LHFGKLIVLVCQAPVFEKEATKRADKKETQEWRILVQGRLCFAKKEKYSKSKIGTKKEETKN
jgi:hypothetical protein